MSLQEQRNADWRTVVDYMSYNGRRHNRLSWSQRWEVYCLADGFGKMTSDQLREINGGWDWSHIRDSSADAIEAMAIRIGEFVSKDLLA